MLCARMLKDEHGQSHNAFYRWSENTFNAVQGFYDRTLRWSLGSWPHHLGRLRRQPGGQRAADDGDEAGLPAQRR